MKQNIIVPEPSFITLKKSDYDALVNLAKQGTPEWMEEKVLYLNKEIFRLMQMIHEDSDKISKLKEEIKVLKAQQKPSFFKSFFKQK